MAVAGRGSVRRGGELDSWKNAVPRRRTGTMRRRSRRSRRRGRGRRRNMKLRRRRRNEVEVERRRKVAVLISRSGEPRAARGIDGVSRASQTLDPRTKPTH
ncbi:hypothetical protein MGYG_02154 [Nannizzia gypsea CBS 118893]|uniref:Uncharacterized protein n=1 Tax=Arthroderma gypseum (strain ATCC MYA-4604 / CBS 118893) TaxID=535722 RepID=E4UQ08_ARTGP|nr:hypothetical protein MGYG_02154 [Nannizzia gypsea CBS 118893]EFQ99142.1 hypothetical protein MGYG_02154 [Nannizzia gypsea CBS 118893]